MKKTLSILKNVLVVLGVYLACCAATELIAGEEVTFEGGWKMTITPGTGNIPMARQQSDAHAEGADEDGGHAVTVNPYAYKHIYDTIPFRRAVFNANPTYRHDATMEIMFGKMRDTVVHRYPAARPKSEVVPIPYQYGPVRYQRFGPRINRLDTGRGYNYIGAPALGGLGIRFNSRAGF